MNEPGRSYEFELDFARLLMLGGLLVLVVGAAFWVGRATAPAGAVSGSGGWTKPAAASPVTEETLGEGSIFDRTGGSASQRETGRQVIDEPSRGGGFELELGRTSGREEAERLRAEAKAVGVPVMVVGADEGGYRVVGGPYRNREQAVKDAKKLGKRLGRKVPVSASGQ